MVDGLGVEPKLQVQKFAYGARTRQLRRDARNARASGVIVREIKAADLTKEMCERLRTITGTGWELSIRWEVHMNWTGNSTWAGKSTFV